MNQSRICKLLKGNKKLAIKNYQKSYDLNPKNTNALNMIKKLKVKN